MKSKLLFLFITLFVLSRPATSFIPPKVGVKMSPEVIKEFQEMQKEYSTGYYAELMAERNKMLQENPSLLETNRELFVDSIYAPTLLGYFTDLPPVYTRQQFQSLLYDGPNPTGTVTDYYKEISYGMMHMSGNCENWAPVLGPVANYNPGTSSGGRKFVWELLQSSDPNVDFSKYVRYTDPQGNGRVPFLVIVHSGGDAAQGAPNIWSHRWSFAGIYGTFMTNDTLPNGKRVIVDGPYAIQAEMRGNSNTGGPLEQIGVFAHELGHIFNLPDLYGVGTGAGEGLGGWCLMASGSYGGDNRTPSRPAHMSVWCKQRMNWISPENITTDRLNLTLLPAENHKQFYRLWKNGTSGSQYFLIENRQKIGFDNSLIESGLMIYHVDDTRTQQNTPSRYWVDMEQADGSRHLNLGSNRGDAGDPFPGIGGLSNPNRVFDGYSVPNSRDYNDVITGIRISNIKKQDSLIVLNATVWDTVLALPSYSNITTTANVSDMSESYGVSAADYNNDGWEDIFVANRTENRLYKNNGNGTFTNMATTAGVADVTWSHSGVWGDYNNDGNTDLYITTFNPLILSKKNILYKNNANGTFSSQTTSDLHFAEKSMGASFADYNNDGLLDVLIVNYINTSRLYKNIGSGLFAIDTVSGLNYKNRGISATWGDFNNDGYQDVYIITKDQASSSSLWQNNQDGTFTNITQTANVGNHADGNSAAWADFNNDGFFDLIVCNENSSNRLYKNNGGGTFTDIAEAAGVSDGGVNNTPLWFDYDLDGNLDLYIAKNGPNRLFKNNGNETFTEVASREGIAAIENYRGATLFDYDNDGIPEIYLANASSTSPNILYKRANNNNKWLTVSVKGNPSNRNGIGTKIIAYTGSAKQFREVTGANGYMSQNSFKQFFGFGNASTIDSLVAIFPSGNILKVINLPTNQNYIFDESIVSVGDIVSVPIEFKLEQNYPNPFNPLTMINYQLPPLANGNNFVSLKVYDVLGREVATLVDGHKSAGYYDVTWDASNMPSGVYIYKLSAGGFTDVRKMILVK